MTAISSHVKDVNNASINWKIQLPPTLPPQTFELSRMSFLTSAPPPKKKSSAQISHPSALKQLFVFSEGNIFVVFYRLFMSS